ncbi:hypothetical protein ACRAWD_07315 [Caulobacter segnis]
MLKNRRATFRVPRGLSASCAISLNINTVFVHSGWRCSSTYVWSRFRALPGVRAYYEPWHEQLARVTARETLDAETPRQQRPAPPGRDRSLSERVRGRPRPGGRGQEFRRRFRFDRFWIEPEASDLARQGAMSRGWSRRPASAARRRSWPAAAPRPGGLAQAPVRRLPRRAGARSRPAVAVVPIRCASGPGRPISEPCHYVLLSEMAGCEDVAHALLGHAFDGRGTLDRRLAAVRGKLKRAPASVSFQAFLAVWLRSLPEGSAAGRPGGRCRPPVLRSVPMPDRSRRRSRPAAT